MDEELRQRLILENISRAEVIAVKVWRRTPNTVELDELKALAYLGLCQAAERWDDYCVSKGYNPESLEFFPVYASRRMNGAILDELRKSDWLTKNQRAVVKKINAAIGDADGYTDSDIAERTGLKEDDIRTALISANTRRPVTLESDDVTDVEVDDNNQAYELMMVFCKTFAELDDLQQLVLVLHYFTGLTFPDVAAELGLSATKTRVFHSSAALRIFEAVLTEVAARE